MTITANIQVSGKSAGGIIFVVGGDDYDSFYANLLTVNGGDAAATDATLAKLRELVNVNGHAPAQQAPPAPAPQQQAAPPGQQSAPTCTHGSRVWKSGTNANSGKTWKGWFCPSTDRSAQCEPQWQR